MRSTAKSCQILPRYRFPTSLSLFGLNRAMSDVPDAVDVGLFWPVSGSSSLIVAGPATWGAGLREVTPRRTPHRRLTVGSDTLGGAGAVADSETEIRQNNACLLYTSDAADE